MNIIKIGDFEYEQTPYGLKQINYKKINYDDYYINVLACRTNKQMCELRLNFLLNVVPIDKIKQCSAIELGPGNGEFFKFFKPYVTSLDGYDEAKTEFSTVDLYNCDKKFDLLLAFDVIEHFDEIDDLWNLDFEIGYFSIPCPPSTGVSEEWRHFKPNEHIWHITKCEFESWVNAHGYDLILFGCPEDSIRHRWDENEININSFIIKKHATRSL